LRDRQISEETIERLLADLTKLGVLNDKEWAASFARGQTRKKVGPRAIVQKLANKGVRGENLKEAVEDSWDPIQQQTMILDLLKTRYSKRDLSDFKERKKVISSLVRRGFDLTHIFACFNQEMVDITE
jgi:SOS response regulatory protein OraA/RecX